MRTRDGFTLIELMIVVAIIAIIAAIAIPNLLSARLNANETSAIDTLSSISSAQAQFQASAKVDVDTDGTGEFGFFRELSAAVGVRQDVFGGTVGAVSNPAQLSGAFRTMDSQGGVSRSGYRFQMLLPGVAGVGVVEVPTGPIPSAVETDLAETTWAALCWPANHGNSGSRTFFKNQTGNVVFTDDSDYSGAQMYVSGAPGIAFMAPGNQNLITGRIAVGTVGRDGNRWVMVN